MLHPSAQSLTNGQGGIYLYDPKNEISQGLKKVAAEVGKAAMKGQVLDLFKIPTPAYMHWNGTQLNLIQNDFLCLDYISKASKAQDPVQRIKHVVTFFVANNFVN